LTTGIKNGENRDMRKIFIISATIISLLTTGVVFAQNTASPSPTPNAGQIMRERNQAKNEIKREIRAQAQEEHKEQIQAKLTERRQNRIRNFYGRLSTRIAAAIARLNTLSERILARLEVIEGEGQNVALLEADVANAQTIIAGAEDLLADLEGMMEDMIESDDPKSFMPTLKDSVVEIKDALKDAHAILVKVITQIKGLRVSNTTE